jgi:hypothetical protein
MFKDLFESSTGASAGTLQLESAFDSAEFSLYLNETDSTINGLVDSYRGVMTEALTESAGIMNESVNLVLEQANEHVGNKIVAALKKLWNWIVKIVDSSINFVMTLVTSNKKFIEKIKPEVAKKNLSAEDLAKITMTSYNYKPQAISTEKVTTVLGEVDAEARADYSAANKEKLDKVVETYNENKRKSAGWEKISLANRLTNVSMHEVQDWARYKDELRVSLQGGEKKTTKTFSMDFFKVIETYSQNAEAIKGIMSKSKEDFKKTIDHIIQKAGYAKAEGKGEGADAKAASGRVAFLNYLRARTAATADAFAELMSMKLSILKREVGEARSFCMHAARYNPKKAEGAASVKNESAAVIPFDPLFEDAEEVTEAGSLTEGAQGGAAASVTF